MCRICLQIDMFSSMTKDEILSAVGELIVTKSDRCGKSDQKWIDIIKDMQNDEVEETT